MNKLVSLKNKLGNKAKNKKGFTLVEMIIVMVIMAILAAALIPTMMGYVQDAKNSKNLAAARACYVAAQSVATELSAKQDSITETNIIGNGSDIAANTKYAELTDDLPGSVTDITFETDSFQIKSIEYNPDGTGDNVTINAGGEATFS